MACGSCPHTDGCCYTSIPPKVKCNITGEYHHYNYECDCKEELIEDKAEEIEKFKEMLKQPGALMMAVNYDSDKAPAVAITGEAAAIAYESLLNLPLYGECKDTETIDKVAVGSTKCLVCGEEIIVLMWDSYTQVCPSCKKAIKYIKEKFSKELDDYEV